MRGLRLSADGCSDVYGAWRSPTDVECSEPKQAPVVQCDAVYGRSRVVERWGKEYGKGCWELPVAMTVVGGDSVMSSKPSRELPS